MHDLTAQVAKGVVSRQYSELPSDVIDLAKQCVLDLFGVAVAGASEDLVNMLVEDSLEQGASSTCGLIGRSERFAPYQAALVNGAIAHALDYDDVNMSMVGHPSAAILPALLALAESRNCSGREFLEAFVAGYEAACQIGDVIGVGNYARGFHCTASIGSFGATAACARLLGLDSDGVATALGIAVTQASGLKLMFGTMCKPMHAGLANQRGLMAAMLAKRGFTSRLDSLENVRGFAETQCGGMTMSSMPIGNNKFYIRSNLFKYHAACYNTHAAIDAIHKITNGVAISPHEIERVVLHADASLDSVCNIPQPKTGLEAKFSFRLASAFALAGLDTAQLGTFSDQNASNIELISLRDKVHVELIGGVSSTLISVEIFMRDGRCLRGQHDSGIPSVDIAHQCERVGNKFMGLVEPKLGNSNSQHLKNMITNLESISSVSELALATLVK